MAHPQPPEKDPSPPPTLDPAALDTAATSLAPALELLERFHHRNKNQHRLSKWWAQADMLRRHVRKMLGELEEGAEEAERAAKVRAKRLKGKRKEDGQGRGEEHGSEAVTKRAEYLRWKLGPGAYLAFTQLTADRQFAHLGLMLLGVLAQVDKAITPFAPNPQDGEQAEKDAQGTSDNRDSQVAAATRVTFEGITNLDASTDMGEAVSREDAVMLSIEQDEGTPIPRPAPAPTPAPAVGKSSTQRSKSLPSRVAALQKEGDSSTSQTPVARTEPASKEGSSTPALQKPKKKKKAMAEGGDEFDDIFGSLEKDKKPKKKKRKKGDEFDDIFGGLL